ncbi:NAD-dependent epimerase/dehydratase family protein [Leptospira terpstrae]|uniref:NAD dependent epimerase/dehydratase family protein n=1 Tax=Leptospira terpstrae serovar Hualin str. LT 11-33 = ATCC 700639 TaxID=1257025 RepID=N1VSF2_9LEPT|nr:SDR family oxidoreductase [Leptospira terpstrae]EMY61343.1 NAD dependent epimerase/dehydratase family protein [Leptospira terpstrae serovar Hualin str. LT 11-33 = ATCC 700639]
MNPFEGSQVFTVIGANGFIGSHLVNYLRSLGHICNVPARDDHTIFTQPLSNVIYCAGITSDFRTRPFDTIEAHVSLLSKILELCDFQSLVYLSSTRIYIHSESTNENSPILTKVNEPEDLFNLSKLLGESICLNSGRKNVRSVRLSNVLGADFQSGNFVISLFREAKATGKINLFTTLDSEKDYIHIQDVLELLLQISLKGKQSIYNVASGQNQTNRVILEKIREIMPFEIHISETARKIKFKPIEIQQIENEFNFFPRSILDLIPELASQF